MQNNGNPRRLMPPENYSAGLVSQSFWFTEFKKAAKLRQTGLTYDEINIKCDKENLFGAAKEYRALRMSRYVTARLKNMDDNLLSIFCTADIATQKLINLLTILSTDRLFFEFVYEVYREKAQLGAEFLEETDVKAFFTRKEAQSESVAGWKEQTKKRLRSAYLNFMTEANLLTIKDGQKLITPPILDDELECYLKAAHGEAFISALTGVN